MIMTDKDFISSQNIKKWLYYKDNQGNFVKKIPYN